MASRRILILHDRFQFRGGAERMVLDMATRLGADILTEFWTEETFSKSEVPHSLFVLDSGEPRAMVRRYFRAHWNFWWGTRRLLSSYDVLIFSGNNCLSAALRPLAHQRRIFYCHSPVRFVYDLLERRRREEGRWWKRVLYYDIGKYVIRALYRLGLSRMQTVLANSRNVQERLRRFCATDSQVLYPPIRTDKFHWVEQGNFYLSWARLDGLKRVEDIVRAFQRLPDQRLLVLSGGEREAAVRALAQGYPNITVRGWVEWPELVEAVGSCIAAIYIPVDEDFGMTPVEAMAAGKPSIVVREGGLTESVVEGETGLFVEPNYTVDDLVAAVRALTPERALAMRAACEARAAAFSIDAFMRELQAIIERPL
jgi:glycosyltransferase involved in cell wall biosynthesis